MKLLFLFPAIIILQVCAYAQNFFPLSPGSKYQYLQKYERTYTLPDTTFPSRIVGDSLLINHRIYRKFGGYYYHYDQAAQKLYCSNDTLHYVDFNLPSGVKKPTYFDGEYWNFKSMGQYTVNIFGQQRTAFRIEADSSFSVANYSWYWRVVFEFVDGIGLSMYYDYYWWDDLLGSRYDLTAGNLDAAIIDSVIYNLYLLDIFTTTPIVDRVISDFPFTIQASLITRHIKLISVFQVEVNQYKNSQFFRQYHININKNTYRASIVLQELAAGDSLTIKLRASDNSIFNLTSTDPDSGYYSMKVLPDYFPMASGNKYQFKWEKSGYEEITRYVKITTGDSIIFQGKNFIKFGDYYYHYNKNENKLYTIQEGIALAVDFNLPAGQRKQMFFNGVSRYFKSEGVSDISVLGQTRKAFTITWDSSGGYFQNPYTFSSKFVFADSIGMYQQYDSYVDIPSNSYHIYNTLQTAIINQKKFNPYNLRVWFADSIKDKPINFFPLTVHIGITATEQIWINSLNVEVIHRRSGTLLNTFNFPFTYSEPQIQVNIPNLASGDYLLFSVSASDTTIFGLTSRDPSLWHYRMHILPDTASGIDDEFLITDFNLLQNYPNPFNPSTSINYSVPELSSGTISVINMIGEVVMEKKTGDISAGNYNFNWDASGYPSGIYLLNFNARSNVSGRTFSKTIKMSLVK